MASRRLGVSGSDFKPLGILGWDVMASERFRFRV